MTHKNFLFYVLLFAVLSSGEWCYVTVAPYYFQNTLHLTPETFGWYLFLSATFYLGGTLFAANTMRCFTLTQLLWIGVVVSLVASFLLLIIFVVLPTSPLFISLAFGLYLLGNAIVWGPSTSRALQSVQDFKGAASAVRSLFLTGFYTLGGFLGSILDDHSLLGVSLTLCISAMVALVILKRISVQLRG